jgi:hypothetical protein
VRRHRLKQNTTSNIEFFFAFVFCLLHCGFFSLFCFQAKHGGKPCSSAGMVDSEVCRIKPCCPGNQVLYVLNTATSRGKTSLLMCVSICVPRHRTVLDNPKYYGRVALGFTSKHNILQYNNIPRQVWTRCGKPCTPLCDCQNPPGCAGEVAQIVCQ